MFGKNETERFFWASWLTFVFVSSVLGDSLILIASIKYNAFNLHKMIVTFIQHIAVNDLLNTLGNVGPTMLSAIYNKGSPYRFIDYVRFFIAYYTSISSSLCISAMVLGKLLLLKHPLKLRSLPKRHVHMLCAAIWVISLSVPAALLGIDKDDVTFDYRTYSSTYKFTPKILRILTPISLVLFLIAPGIVVVVSTALILQEAKKVVRRTQQSLRWQGIITVILTASVYIAAYLPYAVYFMAKPFVDKDPDKLGLFHVEFNRLADGFLKFQIISNFFIYSLTVDSFRRFLIDGFYKTFSVCLKRSSSRGNVQLNCLILAPRK